MTVASNRAPLLAAANRSPRRRIKCVESTLIARVGPFADCRHFLEIARQLGQRGLHVKVDGCACKL